MSFLSKVWGYKMARRKYGTNKTLHYNIDLSYIFLALVLVFYQVLSSIFTYLPILIGFFFCYMYSLLQEKDETLYDLDFRWYFSLVYLLFIDITHDFYLFVSWICFFVFYCFCADWIKTNFKIGKFIPIFFVFCTYLLFCVFDSILSYIDNVNIKIFGSEYFISMGVEALFCYLFFKDKIR